jgi:hypothetical protein
MVTTRRTVAVSALVGLSLLASATSADAYPVRSYAPAVYGPRVLPRYYAPYGLYVPRYGFRSPYAPPYPYVLPIDPRPSPAPAVGDGGRSYSGETLCSRIAQDPPGFVPDPALWHTRPDLPGFRCITMP